MTSLMQKLVRASLFFSRSQVDRMATRATSASRKKKQYYYYKNKNKPQISEEEKQELRRETAEMETATRQLVSDPEALEELIDRGMPEEYDIIYEDPRSKMEAKRNHERAREITKRRILERKYYPQPQELNLLTWAAKEQIKYLNREYPEEWTPKQLAKSFPISPQGVIKLLKSNYVPKTAGKVYEHDKKVVQNWRMLTEGSEGPLAERRTEMIEDGDIERLQNFGGVPSLPKPVSEVVLKLGKRTKPGLFESLVVDSTPKKIESKKKFDLLSLPDGSENLKAISKIVSGFEQRPKSGRTRILDYLQNEDKLKVSAKESSNLEKNSGRKSDEILSRKSISFRRRSSHSNRTLFQTQLDENCD